MIHFVMGKPGGGKGLFVMQKLVDELRNGQRPIVTNLAVKLHPWVRDGMGKHGKAEIGLLQYLQSKFGQTFDAERRIYVLPDEEMPNFYGLRPNGEMQRADLVRDTKGRVRSFDTGLAVRNGGVFYLLDEVWKFWGARNWQETGEGVHSYSAQHRKFGDDVLLVSQTVKQVDSQIRSLCQDFTLVRNRFKERIGLFRQPGVFTVDVYLEPPGPTVRPMQSFPFLLDAEGLGACYDTSAGVGIMGQGGADLGERRKGLPFWLLVLGILGVAGLMSSLPWLIGGRS